MKEITLPKASQLTSPNPVTVVCTRKPDGSTNLATVSWWTYLSYNPGMIAYAMAKPSYSGERVRESGQVILTIPGAAIADAVLGCGTTTGRDTDKAARFHIELAPVRGQRHPDSGPQPCGHRVPPEGIPRGRRPLPLYLQCGKGLRRRGGGSLFAWNGYGKIAPAKQG